MYACPAAAGAGRELPLPKETQALRPGTTLGYQARAPPSTTKLAPVVKDAASDTR
jgi:hypothetical protein